VFLFCSYHTLANLQEEMGARTPAGNSGIGGHGSGAVARFDLAKDAVSH
jgi:hypothetical protein